MASKLTELYREVKGLRRDVEEIKEMLIPEVSPSKEDKKAAAKQWSGARSGSESLNNSCTVSS